MHTTKYDPPSQGNSLGTIRNPLLAKHPNRSRGVTSVEFALASSLFFLLMFMVMDFALFGFVKLTMQHAVREGARYAVTGQATLDPEANGDRTRAIIQKIRDDSMGFFDDVNGRSLILSLKRCYRKVIIIFQSVHR